MLFPKKVKHRKWQRMRRNLDKVSPARRGVGVAFGSHGLKAMSYGRLSSNQIEAGRKAIRRTLGKTGRMWIRVFPDRPVTAKAPEVPMGKGKGDLKGYEIEVYPGRIIFEVDGVTEDVAKEALRKGGTKLSVKVKVSTREA
jgi:large subunit ribosomal protein L16